MKTTVTTFEQIKSELKSNQIVVTPGIQWEEINPEYGDVMLLERLKNDQTEARNYFEAVTEGYSSPLEEYITGMFASSKDENLHFCPDDIAIIVYIFDDNQEDRNLTLQELISKYNLEPKLVLKPESEWVTF